MPITVSVFGGRRKGPAIGQLRWLLLSLHETHGISRLAAGLEMDMVGAEIRYEAYERGSQTSREPSITDAVVITTIPNWRRSKPRLPNLISLHRSLEPGRPFRWVYGSGVRHLDDGLMCDQPELPDYERLYRQTAARTSLAASAMAELRAAATGIR